VKELSDSLRGSAGSVSPTPARVMSPPASSMSVTSLFEQLGLTSSGQAGAGEGGGTVVSPGSSKGSSGLK
jgi:hypothetical protein